MRAAEGAGKRKSLANGAIAERSCQPVDLHKGSAKKQHGSTTRGRARTGLSWPKVLDQLREAESEPPLTRTIAGLMPSVVRKPECTPTLEVEPPSIDPEVGWLSCVCNILLEGHDDGDEEPRGLLDCLGWQCRGQKLRVDDLIQLSVCEPVGLLDPGDLFHEGDAHVTLFQSATSARL